MAKMAFGAKGLDKTPKDPGDTQIRLAAKGKGKFPAFLTAKAKLPKGKKP